MNNDVIKVQLSCGVDYYKGEKGDKPVKGVDYFTEQDINEIIERIEAGEIDLTSYATKEYVANAIEGMVVEETDPTVPEWAKAETKPSYTANEVGALPADTPLFSGNYNDLSNKPTLFSGNYNDLTNKPTIPSVPVNISAFYNDAGYLTSHQSLSGYATESYVDEAIANIELPDGGITVETDPTVPSWAKQANKPTYTAQEVGALPANTALFSGDYNDLSNKPTLTPAPIVIQATIAGQPTVDNDGNYRIPLAITSNNMAEAYAQFQTHPSTVGISVDLTAMGVATKMYLDCESFYRYEVDGGGYTYDTYGEFNDSSLSWQFGFEFHNITVQLATDSTNRCYGKVTGVATVNQLASKANSADLATVATSGNYNDLTNKPTIPTIPSNVSAFTNDAGYLTSHQSLSGYATQSYVDTAIANIPSSGSAPIDFEDGYWSEDNGTYSLDMLAISDYCKEGITTDIIYTTETDETTGDSILLDDKLAQIDTALDSIPAPYTLPTATTSTLGGVKVDGTTITISNGVISATSSGGGSYTAGDGIEIDANGVISRTDIGLTGMSLFASGFINNFSFGDIPSASTLSQLAENLKKYGISSYSGGNFTPTALNEAMGGTRYITQFLSGDIVPNLNWSVNTYNSTSNVGSWGWRDTPCFVIGQDNKIYGTTSFSKLRMLIGWNLGELIYLNGSQLSNLTTSTDIRRLPNLMSDMNNVIGDINTRIPSAPSVDGTYMLKCVVSSGTPTYSWESVSVGGSY